MWTYFQQQAADAQRRGKPRQSFMPLLQSTLTLVQLVDSNLVPAVINLLGLGHVAVVLKSGMASWSQIVCRIRLLKVLHVLLVGDGEALLSPTAYIPRLA